MSFPRIASLKSAADFRRRLTELGLGLEFDEHLIVGASPLAQAYQRTSGTIGNRFAILPMEGWDSTSDGKPSELTHRRWSHFGGSGAKLIWGGEAVAVRHDGRANPSQLVLCESNVGAFAALRETLLNEHRLTAGKTDDLLIGLQLTHSGRFARPNDKNCLEPRIVYRHPLLDQRFGVADGRPLFSDDEIGRLIEDYIAAAKRAYNVGFQFVDIKHCHGYLGHEFLSAVDRPGKYGGSLENRTRFLREIVAGIHAAVPGLEIGVRLSVFDFVPFQPGVDGVGVPVRSAACHPFGSDSTGTAVDLSEPHRFLELLEKLGIELVCTTAGSPYYNPHILRPAAFPPSDGYLPPEDPLVGVARQIDATARLKKRRPGMIFVGSGYSYLQEWLPHVAQRQVRDGNVDFVGVGRMVLSYPEFPADVLAGRPLQRKRLCRTFSDCTSAPRNGLISGCYPLDSFYKSRPERIELETIKRH